MKKDWPVNLGFPAPNLNAQVSKLWQEREWLLRG